MDFEEFIIPGVNQYEEFSLQADQKTVPESTCFDSSAQVEPSSDSDDLHPHKKPAVTRLIRKRYDPIVEGNRVIRYEDDPVQYKKARKKIQNRISATRVRGKKKGEFELLQHQAKELRKSNSELTLANSKLEGENAILKQRVTFLQKMILKQEEDKISSFLTTEQNSNSGSSPLYEPDSSEYDSPFQNQGSWFRSPVSGGFGHSTAYILVMTLILAVVILPSQSSESAILATKISAVQPSPEINQILTTLYQNTVLIDRLKYWGKLVFIGVYFVSISLFAYKKRDVFLKRKKVI